MLKILFLILALLISTEALSKGAHKINKSVTDSISIDDEYDNVGRLVFNLEEDSYKYESTEYLAPMITYSNSGWDIGFSSQNILLSAKTSDGGSTAQNFQNDTYFNLSKTFKYSDVLKDISPYWSKKISFISTTFGSQTGMVLPMNAGVDPGRLNNTTLHLFDFIDNDFELIKNRLSVHGGVYWVNAALSTKTSSLGFLTGAELIILPKTLRISGDFFSGHDNISGAVYQATYMQNKNFEIFSGIGVPTQNSGNYPYLLVGFNLIQIFDK